MASSSSSVPSSSGGKVKITSLVDNREFEVEKEVLEVSGFLKAMAEDSDNIPIPLVGGDTLEKVLQYSELVYKEKKNAERTKERDESFEKILLKDSKLFMEVEEVICVLYYYIHFFHLFSIFLFFFFSFFFCLLDWCFQLAMNLKIDKLGSFLKKLRRRESDGKVFDYSPYV